MLTDAPKLLGNPRVKAERMHQLRERHITPLTDFVETLRQETGLNAGIPYFDPWDGGVDATVLLLLEAPGSMAVSSGFISQNNPDETAKNLFELLQEAGIERNKTVLWSVVPWYIGNGTKIRAATPFDLLEGLKPLHRLMKLLPKVTTIVLLGRKAENARTHFNSEKYRVFTSPHPSPLFVNNAPGNREKLLSVFLQVCEHINSQDARTEFLSAPLS